MVDVERDCFDLIFCIEWLEYDKQEFEVENVIKIEENWNFLDQFEVLNSIVVDFDIKIKSFEVSFFLL